MFHTYRKVPVIAVAIFCLFSSVFAYSGGSGTAENPYQIADTNDLLALAGTPTDCNKCFILTADINMGGQVFTTAIIAPDTNSIISGFQGTAFTGTFDGNGHKIINFIVNGGSNQYLGLFGKIDHTSVYGHSVKNLGLENFSVSGSSYVGGLVGYNNGGSIGNCYSTGTVSGGFNSKYVGGLVGYNNNGGSISNCYSTGDVIGGGYSGYLGGLVGDNEGCSISNCYSTGDVIGGDYSGYLGGLVGLNIGGNISNCYSTGSVSGQEIVGGLVGYNYYGSISNCYSTGSVSGTWEVGGLVGKNNGGTITACFWDIESSGQTTSAGGEGKTTTDMKTLFTFTSAGWDFIGETANGTCNHWQMPAGGGYPVLSIFNGYIPPEPSGSGTEDDPYIITDANDLGTIWYRPSAHYLLTNDIDLAGIQWSMAVVPEFCGVLDGNGFCIKNLSINGASYLGLFGQISSGGEVKNLGLENCSISGAFYVGGLVGRNRYCSISNCYSTGSVSGSQYGGGLVGINIGSISNCYSTGAVSGFLCVGGLVGVNYGSISSISNCYSTGTVTGVRCAGGLVGYNYYGSISNCYSTGAVDGNDFVGGLVGDHYGGNIVTCYSAGAVIGDSNVGGLVGDGNGVTTASFWDVNTSGWSTSAGGEGKTTEQMQDINTFLNADWDFDYTDGDPADWFIQIEEYPILTWQISPADIYTDGRNNFRDFAVFAQYWMRGDCAIYNYYCDWADLDFNGSVDIDDLIVLMSYWLESGIYE